MRGRIWKTTIIEIIDIVMNNSHFPQRILEKQKRMRRFERREANRARTISTMKAMQYPKEWITPKNIGVLSNGLKICSCFMCSKQKKGNFFRNYKEQNVKKSGNFHSDEVVDY